jgi:hypothetical protein
MFMANILASDIGGGSPSALSHAFFVRSESGNTAEQRY